MPSSQKKPQTKGHKRAVCGCFTLGVEGDEAVTQRPLVHRLVEDNILWKDDHSDVLKPAQPLQDLGHWLGLGLLHHATDPHHDLLLRRLSSGEKEDGNVSMMCPRARKVTD